MQGLRTLTGDELTHMHAVQVSPRAAILGLHTQVDMNFSIDMETVLDRFLVQCPL